MHQNLLVMYTICVFLTVCLLLLKQCFCNNPYLFWLNTTWIQFGSFLSPFSPKLDPDRIVSICRCSCSAILTKNTTHMLTSVQPWGPAVWSYIIVAAGHNVKNWGLISSFRFLETLSPASEVLFARDHGTSRDFEITPLHMSFVWHIHPGWATSVYPLNSLTSSPGY